MRIPSFLQVGLLSVLLALTNCRAEPTPTAVREELLAVRRAAVEYLLTQQGEDGGWHSRTHGILRGGQAYTPFLTDALLDLRPAGSQLERALDRAFQFIQQGLDTAGVLGRSNPLVAEYPVYATALALKVWSEAGNYLDSLKPAPSLEFLLSQQFNESRGIGPDHPAYGGWGFGETQLAYGEVGHLDLSHTRRVLEALAARALPDTAAAWAQAAVCLERLQQSNGGFCASTYTLGANKADRPGQREVPYATATADGILALLALPHPPVAKVSAARDWLLSHEDWRAPAGILPGQPGDWDKVLFYYHLCVRAQAHSSLAIEDQWPKLLLEQVRDRQSANGSFSNPWGAPNKEDDPLLATTLVIKAINAAVRR
jgi:hypothetical protein